MVSVSMLKINGSIRFVKSGLNSFWWNECKICGNPLRLSKWQLELNWGDAFEFCLFPFVCPWIIPVFVFVFAFVFVTCLSRNHPSRPKLLGLPLGGHWSQKPPREDTLSANVKTMHSRMPKRMLFTSMLSISILLLIALPCQKSEKSCLSPSHQFWGS